MLEFFEKHRLVETLMALDLLVVDVLAFFVLRLTVVMIHECHRYFLTFAGAGFEHSGSGDEYFVGLVQQHEVDTKTELGLMDRLAKHSFHGFLLYCFSCKLIVSD